MKKPTLVIMAAGMGSRFGGLKQIEPVDNQGHIIIDFSLFDAWRAGFRNLVFVIKPEMGEVFREIIGYRMEPYFNITYVYQTVDNLPSGYTVPEGREKPWGTSHAVLCAKEAIDGAPFAVINADDYYGKDAFKVIFDYLSSAKNTDCLDCCMVGYLLGNTVTEHGSVARGVCTADENGYLADIVERLRIEKYEGGIRFIEDEGATDLPADTIVSMNMWGFTPGFLELVEGLFPEFFETVVPGNPMKGEFLLPRSVDTLLKAGKLTVKMLKSADKWYGVTYAADKPIVVAALSELTQAGKYPVGLWE